MLFAMTEQKWLSKVPRGKNLKCITSLKITYTRVIFLLLICPNASLFKKYSELSELSLLLILLAVLILLLLLRLAHDSKLNHGSTITARA